MNILGLDLAAKENNQTGYYFKNNFEKFGIVYKNREIIELVESLNPDIILIDSPLSYKEPYRDIERELYNRGFRPLPLSMKYMKVLTYRAMKLKEIFENMNIEVFETFPRAIEKILNINYLNYKEKFRNKHIYDSFLCYIAGYYYSINKYEIIGNLLILPKI